MHLAFRNPNQPVQKPEYKCGVCQLYFGWRNGDSGYYERFSPNWIGEDYFFLCSEVCHQKALSTGMIDDFYKKQGKIPKAPKRGDFF